MNPRERYLASLPARRSKLVHVYVDNGRVQSWTKYGLDKKRDEPRADQLMIMLSGGVLGGLPQTLDLLAQLDRLERGELEAIKAGGNDVELVVRRDGAEIANNILPENSPACFTFEEIRDAVLDLRDVRVEEKTRQANGLPPTLGPEALRRAGSLGS